MKIVVGTDGSEQANRAVEWCATYAVALDHPALDIYAGSSVRDEPCRYPTGGMADYAKG